MPILDLVRLIFAAGAACIAFKLGGMLLTFPFEASQVDFLGIKDWLNATVIGAMVGIVLAPISQRRIACAIFIGLPLLLALSIAVRGILQSDYSPAHTTMLLQTIFGCLIVYYLPKLSQWVAKGF